MTGRTDKITTATSSASLYDNVNNPMVGTQVGPGGKILKSQDSIKSMKEKQNETCQTTPKTANVGIGTVNVGSQVRTFLSLLSLLCELDPLCGV